MFLLDSLLVGGLRFVLDKVALAAREESESPEALHRQLLEAQLQLEDGAITENEFRGIERAVLTRLRELTASRSGGVADGESFEDIQITVDEP